MFGAVVVGGVVAVAVVRGAAVTRCHSDPLADIQLDEVEQFKQNWVDELLPIYDRKAVCTIAVAEEEGFAPFAFFFTHRIEQIAFAAKKLFCDGGQVAS